MTTMARHAVKATGAASALAALAALGFPAVAAAVSLAVLVLAAACWVIASGDRSANALRIILGLRGDPRCLDDPPRPSRDTLPSVVTPPDEEETC